MPCDRLEDIPDDVLEFVGGPYDGACVPLADIPAPIRDLFWRDGQMAERAGSVCRLSSKPWQRRWVILPGGLGISFSLDANGELATGSTIRIRVDDGPPTDQPPK